MAKQIKKTKPVTLPKISDEQLLGLRKWNLRLAAFFFLQALAIAIIGTSKTVSVTTNYLTVDSLVSSAVGQQTLAVATRHLFDVRLAWLVASFLLVFALTYLAAATIWRKRYENRLRVGMNDMRWAGLGVGGGLMLVTVALLSGMQALTSVVMLFILVLCGSLAILAAEEIARRENGKKALLSHLVCAIGTAGLVLPWVVLAVVAGSAWLYDGKVPGFLVGIYASMFMLFVAGFVLTHFRIERKGRTADTLRTERAYILLTVVAASALAWQIFAGALQP